MQELHEISPVQAHRSEKLRRVCIFRDSFQIAQADLSEISREEQDDEKELSSIRTPCTCYESVWLCQPCGQSLRTADTTYRRGWAWRTRYSACGGIGAGLGEGNEGVECGRQGDCLNFREVEKEIECDADETAALEAEMEKAEIDGRQWASSSYNTSEMVGLGGRVKRKIKKQVRVGAIVKEYEDERKTGKFLQREQEGTNRGWCSWCARVVPGKKDADQSTMSTDSIASSSSEPSS